jgi:hypothetical protein
MVIINSTHSRESNDIKFVIYNTILVKIEFLETKKDEIQHKKFYIYQESVIYDNFGIIRFLRVWGIF